MGVLRRKDTRKSTEAEANRFAAALLTPAALFTRDIRQLGSPETEHVLALAKKYKVSKEMAARRYTDLCDKLCAIVFSHRGTIRYFPKSPSCPVFDIRKGNPLPPGSLSARAHGQPGHLSEWFETVPDLWFGAWRRLSSKVLYEQYLEQQDGYRLTMLTVDDVPHEDEPDEEAELDDSWSVRFRGEHNEASQVADFTLRRLAKTGDRLGA
jgi:hypothetical protein